MITVVRVVDIVDLMFILEFIFFLIMLPMSLIRLGFDAGLTMFLLIACKYVALFRLPF